MCPQAEKGNIYQFYHLVTFLMKDEDILHFHGEECARVLASVSNDTQHSHARYWSNGKNHGLI